MNRFEVFENGYEVNLFVHEIQSILKKWLYMKRKRIILKQIHEMSLGKQMHTF